MKTTTRFGRFQTSCFFAMALISVVGVEVPIANAQVASEQAVTPEAPRELLTSEVTLEFREERKQYLAKIDLKPLTAGGRYRLRIRLNNSTDQDIRLAGFEATCRCVRLDSELGNIPAHGAGELEVLLDAPRRLPQTDVVNQIQLIKADKPRGLIRLELHYELSDMFAVGQSQVELVLPRNRESISERIPLVIAAPLTLDRLELIVAKSLQNVAVRFNSDADGPHIYVEANRNNLDDGPLSGSIGVRRKQSEDSDGFFLTIREQSPITVRPEALQLGWDTQRQRMVGNALVQLNQRAGEADEIPIKVQLIVGEQTADLELRQVGNSSSYRVSIQCDRPKNLTADKPVPVVWKVDLGPEELEIKSQAFLAK